MKAFPRCIWGTLAESFQILWKKALECVCCETPAPPSLCHAYVWWGISTSNHNFTQNFYCFLAERLVLQYFNWSSNQNLFCSFQLAHLVKRHPMPKWILFIMLFVLLDPPPVSKGDHLTDDIIESKWQSWRVYFCFCWPQHNVDLSWMLWVGPNHIVALQRDSPEPIQNQCVVNLLPGPEFLDKNWPLSQVL